MEFIPKDEVKWKEVRYIKTPLGGEDDTAKWSYKLTLPVPLADWDVFSYWERERVESMEKHLSKGMVLYDVGTESGWLNLVYAKMVGPSNIFLIEPTQEFWPNIKATWEKNFGDKMPLGTFSGLMGDEITTGKHGAYSEGWPACADGDLIDRNSYTYIHDNAASVSQSTIDTAASIFKRPDAITIDVEGAEMLVLKGAHDVLRDYRPKIWVSIHPDLGLRDYGMQDGDVHAYLGQWGYKGEHLSTDHEEHWFFEVKE